MRHTKKVRLMAPATPPTIEFDASVLAWYVRFTNAAVAKTVSEDAPGYVYAIDFDAQDGVVGIELLGVREFSIEMLLKLPSIDFSRTNFERARFVPSSREELATA